MSHPEPRIEPKQRQVLTVSQLNREARTVLEGTFPLLWLEGEISNLARPGSGHLYFSLKDEFAQVRCAMFRMRNTALNFRPANGMHVLARVRVGLYEPRGEFQLVVEHMEEAGDGALRRAFETLKQRLQEEGLFDAARKRPLPALPRAIGVVTSPTGAAIRDILSVLKRRFPAIPVIVYPVPVQGEGAGRQIAAMIHRASSRGECDVLIVGRGGGSLEDLWAFNEEVVARAIHAATVPVVSAVGHEVDFTIADFVADARAPTPSAAAELLSPEHDAWQLRVARMQQRLHQCVRQRLSQKRQGLQWIEKRLRHPGRRLQEIAQRLDELEHRLTRAQASHVRHRASHLTALSHRLARHTPLYRLERLQSRRTELARRLASGMSLVLERRGQQLAGAARALDAVSPLATLARGYAIVRLHPDGKVLRDSRETKPGDQVEARLGNGRLLCRVEETDDEPR